MNHEDFRILLALEPTWTVSFNGLEFQTLPSTEIFIQDSTVTLGRWVRKIVSVEWLRPNSVKIRGRGKVRSQIDVFMLYPGERIPGAADLRRRRRSFQTELRRALCAHLLTRSVQREIIHSDRAHAIGGAYPRFLIGNRAVIAVHADETGSTINGIMRAALLWAPLVGRRMVVVIPKHRSRTIVTRLEVMPHLRDSMDWLAWDGQHLEGLPEHLEPPETQVHPFALPNAEAEVSRICNLAPELLQAVPYISGSAVSIRLRGIEVAQIRRDGTVYPLGEPLDDVIAKLAALRCHGSGHPLSRAHEERWLESNLIGTMKQILPPVDREHIYPQVPSFVGEERNIIDLLTATKHGRLVVLEIKASADPDLPFQALDYWIAVERHRRAGDFQRNGYFRGLTVKDERALLVLVAPLLSFHRTMNRLTAVLPKELPVVQIGLNQSWKKEIKILRRRGWLG